MKLTWYGHSAFRLDFDGASVLLDPFFTGNPAFTGNADEAASGVGHILLSHGHSNHVGDTLSIAKKGKLTTIANFDLCMALAAKGLENFNPMNCGGEIGQGAFRVAMTPALHSSCDFHDGVSHALGNANGIIIKVAGGPTVYFAGDTDAMADMALINDYYKPDIGIFPIGDRFTMGGDKAAWAAKKFFSFKTLIPCHYGSFDMIDPTADRLVAAMGGAKTTVLVPEKNVAVSL